MSHYFVAGNMWLVVAAVVWWGRVSNSAGDLSGWTLFAIGRTFEAYQYPWCLGFPIVMAATCFALHLRWIRNSPSQDGV
jgi:hypothetical protein